MVEDGVERKQTGRARSPLCGKTTTGYRTPDTSETRCLASRYVSAMLVAPLFRSVTQVCSHFADDRRNAAFITEAPTVRAILTHLGEPSEAPPICPCRGPPAWEVLDQTVDFDPIHPEPEYEFDQNVSW